MLHYAIMGESQGNLLKKIRKSLGYKSQTKFAETIFLSQGGYSDLENGRTKILERHLLLLESVHNVNPEYLKTGGQGEMFKDKISGLEELKGELEKLKKQNESLIAVIQSQQETINFLKGQIENK